MRYILSFLLFCLIFQNIVSQKLSRVQLTANGLFLREHKQKLRKLQNTDTTEDTSGPTLPEPEPYTMPLPGQPENVPATANNSEVPFNTTVSSVPKRTGNKKAPVQFSKFYGFQPGPNGRGLFKFNVLFYLMRIIPKFIIFRLRITYGARLRNLALGDSGTAESVRSDCTAGDPNAVGLDASTTGQNVKFTCEANSTGDVSTANVQVNTDVPLTIVEADGSTSTLGFDNINFNGNAAEEAANLGKVQDLTEWHILKDTVVSLDGQYLVLSGTLETQNLRRLALSESDPIIMQLSNQNNENNASDSYSCNYVKGTPAQLRCDASNKELKTSDQDLQASSGSPSSTNGTLVQVQMKNPSNGTAFTVGGGGSGSGTTYRKSSSGLSGGAIAGIVIACVVVLVAAAIAAIMLRKPTPPVENTTVAELRTDNI